MTDTGTDGAQPRSQAGALWAVALLSPGSMTIGSTVSGRTCDRHPQIRGKIVPAVIFDEVRSLLKAYRAEPGNAP